MVLEGFHALKHALRFGAEVVKVVTADPALVRDLGGRLAPDVAEPMLAQAIPVAAGVFAQLAPVPPETAVMALARRPAVAPEQLLAAPRQAPLVFLETPTHLGNVGAVIRVAAAAGAAGVITSGPHDPWHPTAVRGAAGLHFALPVGRVNDLDYDALHGPLLAVHPEGEPLTPGALPAGAILAFGSERRGLSSELLARAAGRLTIPMEPGVSSLNLATAAAVTLYTWRLSHQGP